MCRCHRRYRRCRCRRRCRRYRRCRCRRRYAAATDAAATAAAHGIRRRCPARLQLDDVELLIEIELLQVPSLLPDLRLLSRGYRMDTRMAVARPDAISRCQATAKASERQSRSHDLPHRSQEAP